MLRTLSVTALIAAGAAAPAFADDAEVRVHRVMTAEAVERIAASDCETVDGVPSGLTGTMPARLDTPEELAEEYLGAGRLLFAYDTGSDGSVRNVRPIELTYPMSSPVMTASQRDLFFSAVSEQLGAVRLQPEAADAGAARRDCIAWSDFVVE